MTLNQECKVIIKIHWLKMARDKDQKESMVDLYKVDAVTLSVMSADEARKQSVTVIDDPIIYNDNGDPKSKGINDDRLGTMDMDRICKTCMGSQVDCPGHFGHIELYRPVFHANLLDYIRKVLKAVCYNCSHLMANDGTDAHELELKNYAEIVNNKSRFKKVQKMSSGIKKCSACKRVNNNYKRIPLGIEYEIMDPNQVRPNNDTKQMMLPEDAKTILSKITPEHLRMLGLDKEKSDPANMILTIMAVGPPPIRPSVQVTGSMSRGDDDLTIIYNKIVKQNNEIKSSINRGNNETAIRELRKGLQFYCAALMSNNNAGTILKHKSGQPLKAIRERLKGKEGRLRGNLMGKRCDFTARSVITCDPNLRLDQLGVPKEIAMNMTIPEVVTEQNINYLRHLVVENGAYVWPGAKFVKRTDGRLIDLSILQNRTDAHLEPGYIVERHLQDNDYVIFNRQPSLHKMSMMGHRIKVLDFQTFRLNLSVTTPYNADFDGDEMNMHVPQSMETKAEIKEIMAVPKQIVAPQSNKPCMGIVQDALLGINRMTSRDTFVEKHILMNILMFVDYDIEKGLPQPAILKPKPLWSGKQVISLVIPDEINAEYGGDYKDVDRRDTKVVVQNGQLLEGILGKGTVGNAAQSLIHLVWKDLGPQACCDLLSNIQLVVNNWLVNTGFTVGVQDIIAKPEILAKVHDEIQRQKRKVRKIIKKTQLGKLKQQPGKGLMESLEAAVNNELNEARNRAGNLVLNALEPTNRLKNMVGAGSKGSDLNISQIMSCCGQQNVEGKRMPFGFNRRTLPHFVKDDYGPESRGFVENSYVSGLTPSEFYFHAMGGREGVIDTAVKTADTGYISRRLMKALEDVMVKYDGTVRTSREILVQFLYGEDGMAGEHFENISLDLATLSNDDLSKKCNFLHDADTLGGFKKIEKAIGTDFADTKRILSDESIREFFKEEFEQLRKDRQTLRTEIMIGSNKELEKVIMPVNIPRMIMNVKAIKSNQFESKLTKADIVHYFRKVKQLQEELIVVPEARFAKSLRDSKLIRESNENACILFRICLRRYLCFKNIFLMHQMSRTNFDHLVTKIKEAFDAAIVNAGEMVGSVAANSIGEPATQMTLNTFHNAGISSKNVTLGVPRLREIINVAKNLKTPSLKIFLDPKIQRNESMVNRVGAMIEYLNLSHITGDWGIYYDPDPLTTVIEADKDCVDLYQSTREDSISYEELRLSRWVLRFAISDDPQVQVMFNEDFSFTKDVGELINKSLNRETINTGTQMFEVVYSDDIMPKKVVRIRPCSFDNISEIESIELLRELAEDILNITLRGVREITKIFTTKNVAADCNQVVYDQKTGGTVNIKENFIIETDGIALSKVLTVEGVDATRTTSNSVYEILQVLGIEATRLSLINELRFVLGNYGIYVNYRHITTLVDVMTMRGILCSITRHGINRTNCGAIRKCTFEETTEILLEAAFFGEKDPLSGISENIIFGQLAPYGTGCFDVVMDTKSLEFCIERQQNTLFAHNSLTDYTPMHNEYLNDEGGFTPAPGETPAPYVGGSTSFYPQSPYGQSGSMTPINKDWGQSPNPLGFSPNPYSGGASTPRHGYVSSPAYPVHQTPQTPYYQGGQTSGQYSPTTGNMMGSGTPYGNYQANYSPTHMNVNQTPVYGSNHYLGGGMTPRQAQVTTTPKYTYGGGPTPGNAYQMPKQMSPSMNPSSSQSPIVSSMGGGSVGNLPVPYSNSPSAMASYASGSTPQYQGGILTPSGQHQQFGGATITPGAGALAYDPSAIPNPDSSDSDN